jgi:uncharacterized membrane protein
MISKWRWLLGELLHRLWVRASLFAAIGIVTALAGLFAERFLPSDLPDVVGSSAVATVLNVLASSMLAVTTFSLGVMVTAYGNVTANATPRATRLLISDSTSQNALSTFLGSFLFSLVGIVTLTIEGYGERGRIVLFVVTLGVIVVIVVTMLRWMEYLMSLGRVGETSQRLEHAATRAMADRLAAPHMGGNRWLDERPGAWCVASRVTGYVQHVDVGALQSIAEKTDSRIHLDVLPGTFVHAGRDMLFTTVEFDEGQRDRALNAITIGDARTFDQDPRFGILVLAEVASRALSPGINDAGTAIDVVGRLARVLLRWGEPAEATEIRYGRIWVHPLSDRDLVDDAFAAIARDGAGRVEVQIRIQKALGILANCSRPGLAEAARQAAKRAAELASTVLDDHDRQKLTAAIASK